MAGESTDHHLSEVPSVKQRKKDITNKMIQVRAEANVLQQELNEQERLLQTVKKSYQQEKIKTNQLKKKLNEMWESRSWRYSVPIRKLGALFKKSSKNTTGATYEQQSGHTAKESAQDQHNQTDARILEKKLWGGYATYALEELETLKMDLDTTKNERIRALRSVARWHFNRNKFHQAYDHLTVMKELNLNDDRMIEKIKVLKKLGEIELGKRNIWRAIQKNGLTSELCLALAHLASTEHEKMNWYNFIYDQHGYKKIRMINSAQPLELGNIFTPTAIANPAISHYKVSIIIPAYNAAGLIHIPLNSLLNQSVQNLEIIVVDDCSSDHTAQVVSKFAARDKRIKLISKEKNEGAYAARNTGLQYATGDFITIHDSDDWSHSQKIEVQLEELIDNFNKICSVSFLVRVDKNIVPLHVASLLNENFLQSNTSSLLFHKSVVEKLGGWDSVRVAGDTEFLWRIQTAFGEESIMYVEPDIPFSLSLAHDNSLTGTTVTHAKTILFGLRRTYREAAQWWHRHVESVDDLYMDPAKVNRPFPCPISNLINNPSTTYDCIMIADFSANSHLDQLEAMLTYNAGQHEKMAIFHWPDYRGDPSRAIADQIYKFIQQKGIDILVPNENVQTKTLFILTPRILNFALDQAPEITCERAIIVSNKEVSSDSKVRKEENLKKTLRVEAEWTTIEGQSLR